MSTHSSFDRRQFLKVTGSFGFLCSTAETAAAVQQSSGTQNELLVGVAPSANARRTAERTLPAEARIVGENATLGYVRAELPDRASATAKASVADAVAANTGVEYAEPNAIYETTAVPNDPRFGDQYAPEMVSASGAWDTTYGDGEVTVAVVDQGIKDDHPDLEAAIASDPGRDFVDDDDDPYPDSLADEHHGTHVAGIAAAGTDNETGVAGISNATLLSVRALNETSVGSTADIADGIQWAADNGADIINLSLSGGYTETMQRAVAYAHEQGALLVAAAGNESGPVSYPAAYDECIAVSALNPDESLASYSNTGPEIELTAPGTNLLSTWTDDGYATLSGTSMAAPVVSGVAALILSQKNLTNGELRSHLENAAVDVGLSSDEQGSGRVDAAVAMNDGVSTLRIKGSGSRSDYVFSTSGSVTPIEVNEHDNVRASSGEGLVGGGTDSYALTGDIVSLALDGDALVSLDNREIDPRKYPDLFLEIVGSGSRTDYEFSTSGRIEPVQINEHDTVRERGAEGLVGGGVDSYAFSGEIETFALDGSATVRLNGETIDPDQYLDNRLMIEGTGPRADYSFSVSGDIEPVEVNEHDTVRASGAEGLVGGGTDRYAFSGDLRTFSLDGNATIRLNDTVIDPAQYGKNFLTIEGAGSRADYAFSVSGSIEPVDINEHDTVQASSAEGLVGGGTDRYAFAGTLTQFELTRGARIEVDRSASTVSILGMGPRVNYTFSVSGDVEPVEVNGHDTVRASSAEGLVGSGTDTYQYTGELRSLELASTVVTITNEETSSDSSPTIGIHNGLSDANFDTIDRMGTWQDTDYDVQNLFVPWNPDTGHLNWLFERTLPKIWNAGRTPLITWEPYTPGARAASVDTQSLVEQNEYDAYLESLADTTPEDIEVRIGNGEYDRYIDRWAGRLRNALSKSGDRRAYLRLAHEMNGNWYPWSPTVGSSSPRSYVRMWRHVHDRFDRQGTSDDLQWMWCVNAEDVGSYTAEQLYPGNGYVDWLGLDGYNWGRSESWSNWKSPDSIYGGMLDRFSSFGNKPICVAEFASSSKVSNGYDPQRKNGWIRNALTYFDKRGVDLWCWFNENKETDWKVFDSARGTETVTHNGERVDAYRAYRKTVGTDVTAANATIPEPSTTERIDSD